MEVKLSTFFLQGSPGREKIFIYYFKNGKYETGTNLIYYKCAFLALHAQRKVFPFASIMRRLQQPRTFRKPITDVDYTHIVLKFLVISTQSAYYRNKHVLVHIGNEDTAI